MQSAFWEDRDAAIRLVQRLQPAAGPGTKLFPPTFEGGVYAFERRRIDGESRDCVLLDSVASVANRQEEALAELADDGRIELPRIVVDFSDFPEIGSVSTLQAPHRIFDAIFRDSEQSGKRFDKSALYTELSQANVSNATSLFGQAPNALLFGCWDSTGAAGGMGNKFPRRIVSEVVGVGVERGVTRGGVRRDPLSASSQVELEIDKDGDWQPKGLAKSKGERKSTRPSEVNHGNILVATKSERVGDTTIPLGGGVTCDYAQMIGVVSLNGIRRLRFPDGGKRNPARDRAAHDVLVALGLLALTAQRELGYSLRSRCDLVADGLAPFERIRHDGSTAPFSLSLDEAIDVYHRAIRAAQAAGLPWQSEPLQLKPQPKLAKLVELSRQVRQPGD